MSEENITRLVGRARQAGKYSLDEIRDHFRPQVSGDRVCEVVARVHLSVKDLSEAERVVALVGALMMELI